MHRCEQRRIVQKYAHYHTIQVYDMSAQVHEVERSIPELRKVVSTSCHATLGLPALAVDLDLVASHSPVFFCMTHYYVIKLGRLTPRSLIF